MRFCLSPGLRRGALVAALLPVLGGAVPQAARPQGSSRHVVLISLDGFPSWALDDPSMPVPTLRKLAESGAVASAMRPVNPSVTWPNTKRPEGDSR